MKASPDYMSVSFTVLMSMTPESIVLVDFLNLQASTFNLETRRGAVLFLVVALAGEKHVF